MKTGKNSGIIISIIILAAVFILAFVLSGIAPKNNSTKDSSSNQVSEGPTFINTVWRATEINSSPLVANTAVSVQFDNNGRLTGFDGCNNFNTTYSISGTNLKINSPVASTLKACSQNIMNQAETFNKLLLSSTSYKLEGGMMNLLQGNTAGLSFSGATNGLAKTSWDITGYNNGKMAVVSPILNTNPQITFGDDGTVSGSTGCNTFSGTYSINGEAISISTLATTRRECFEPEGIMQQESSILDYLSKAKTWHLQGDQMSLRTAEDQLAITGVSSAK